jgi:hypothetical protein
MGWKTEEGGSLFLWTAYPFFVRISEEDNGCEWIIYETPVLGPSDEQSGQVACEMRDGGDCRNLRFAVGWARNHEIAKVLAVATLDAAIKILREEMSL